MRKTRRTENFHKSFLFQNRSEFFRKPVRELRLLAKKDSPACFCQFRPVAFVRKLRLTAKQVHPVTSRKGVPNTTFITELRLFSKHLSPFESRQSFPVAFVRKLRLTAKQRRPVMTSQDLPVAPIRKLRLRGKKNPPAHTAKRLPYMTLIREFRTLLKKKHPEKRIQFLPRTLIRKLRLIDKQKRPPVSPTAPPAGLFSVFPNRNRTQIEADNKADAANQQP